MPAPFASTLCGFRPNGNPNTSDNHDDLSKVLGRALFDQLGVPAGQIARKDPGADMEIAIVDHLKELRPELDLRRSRSAVEFEQYAHLGVFPEFREGHVNASPRIDRLRELAASLPASSAATKVQTEISRVETLFEEQDRISERLISNMPEESFLKLDITCGEDQPGLKPRMHVGLSSKWSLRTDRAQDCVSQGSKLASQRRGPMPHFAVITMEPRPAMLRILADGSGAIDYVYHLDLPALTRAMAVVRSGKPAGWPPGRTFDRLLQQGRLRDYDDLVKAVKAVPSPPPLTIPAADNV